MNKQKKKRCIDCGKKVTSLRCKSCSNKNRKGKYKINYTWNKGLTKETSEGVSNISNSLKQLYSLGHAKCGFKKGDNIKEKVSYDAIHSYIKRYKKKSRICHICKKIKLLELANLSGKYKRDVNDYIWLCRSCHHKFDWKERKRDNKGKFMGAKNFRTYNN